MGNNLQKIKDFLCLKPGYLKTSNEKLAHRLNVTTDEVKQAKVKYFSNRVEELSLQEGLNPKNIKTIWLKEKGQSIKYSINYQNNPEDSSKQFQDNFKDFLKDYKPKCSNELALTLPIVEGCLLINIQDAHYNKLDESGSNNLNNRFDKVFQSIQVILEQCSKGYLLDKVVYVIGSDHFNSEWTNATTKGTAQQNMTSFHEGFTEICNNEISIIELIRNYSDNIEIVFIPGNHDNYVSWHMIHWLNAYYRSSNIEFDINPDFTKCFRYGNSGVMLNHGDAMKPEKLAGIFPQVFKKEWSNCDYQYVFIGDKHHILAKDINGIQFYQLPALSSAKSSWDLKNGYQVSKSELQAFFISKTCGLKTIYKENL